MVATVAARGGAGRRGAEVAGGEGRGAERSGAAGRGAVFYLRVLLSVITPPAFSGGSGDAE